MSFSKKASGSKKFSEKLSAMGFQSKAKTGGILHKSKPVDYNVYYQGEEVTPKPLTQQILKLTKEKQISLINLASIDTSTTKIDVTSFRTQSVVQRFKTEISPGEFNRSFIGTGADDTFFLQSILTEATDSGRILAEREPEEVEDKQIKIIPEHCSLILNETETFFILDIPSASYIKGTNEGDIVEKLNDQYEYLTVGKGRNRKTIEAMAQTFGVLMKTRETEAPRIKSDYRSTFASNWEMYDTFEGRVAQTEESGDEHEDKLHSLNQTMSVESMRLSAEEKELQRLVKNERFLQAVLVIERLLANNNYNIEQQRFKGLRPVNVFREDVQFNYRLDLLWTFANMQTAGRSVTSIDWNSRDEDILVVGYGRFFFGESWEGAVMVWNVKNPVQPERSYWFNEPVSTVAFSHQQPHLIAVGFSNGHIEVLDVRKRAATVVNRSARDANASFECVNHVTFYSGDEHYSYEEQIIACFNDGRTCKFRLNILLDMPSAQIMRAPESDGKIKGIEKVTTCGIPPIPLTKYTGAMLLTYHPVDPSIYYLSTCTGVIHKCSTNYFNQHLDLLLAHDGPIYAMSFSPFCNKIYATCGGDWYIRIWAEGITEPLLELSTVMHPVESVVWSPTHSTILVAIQSNEVQIWDLQRKIHYPQNTIRTQARNTVIKFTGNGQCLTVCDCEGDVRVYSLEDMPVPAFFQDDVLSQVLKKALITRPEMLKKFFALGSLNFQSTKEKDK